MTTNNDSSAEFIKAACVPREGWHGSGTLEEAEAILAARPEIGNANIYAAAVLGDDAAVRRFVARDAGLATAKGGPYAWDALTYLCFSRFLRLDRARSAGFLRAAEALLDAGASANTGWFEQNHQPKPEWESVLYGVAGVARNPELTRLLLERGANPNDGETPYHAPETYDNTVLKILVEGGKLTDESLATMLLRKTDWHDFAGIKWLLERGANPNFMGRWGNTALHHAILRDNALEIIEALLDHKANPALLTCNPAHSPLGTAGRSAVAMAARKGRGDVLAALQRRGFAIDLQGLEQLLSACARNDAAGIRAITARQPQLVSELLAEGGKLLADFAGNGNTESVGHLLDLGVDIAALYKEGDGYFGVAKESMAIHVAAWRARHATVKFLLQRGSPIDVPDGKGCTPLALAIRACVDSHWAHRRSPESVEALLGAGAAVNKVGFPCGYAEVDELLRRHGAGH